MNLKFSSSPCNKYNAVDFRTGNNNYKIGYIIFPLTTSVRNPD